MNSANNIIHKSKEELVNELRILQTENQKLNTKLKIRTNEFQVIYNICSLSEKYELSLNDFLEKIVELIPPCWQFPEITCARITFGEHDFKTSNFKTTKWKQTEIIHTKNAANASIEVFYLLEKPKADEGPFLKEERNLLKVFANNVSKIIEAKDLLTEMKDSEEKFGIAFQKSPVAKCLVDILDNFRFLDVNEAFLNLTGLSREALEGSYLRDIDFFSKELINSTLIPNLKQKAKVKDFEITFQDKSGEFKTGLINIEIILLKTKKIALVAINDISELKRNRDKIFESERRLQSIFENMQDAYFQIDLDGKLSYFNPMALQMYGYSSQEELLGKPSAILYADIGDRKILLNKLQTTGKALDYTGKALRKDGTTFWASMNAQFIYDSHGNIIGTQGVVRDITERRNYEKKIHESEKKFRDIFENMPSSYVLFELIFNENGNPIDHRLIEANNEFNKHSIINKDKLIGLTSEQLPVKFPKDILQKYYKVGLTGEPCSLERFNETLQRYYDIRVTSPKKGQFALLFNDITKRKEREKELLINQKLLLESQRIAKVGSWEMDIKSFAIKWSEELYRIYEIEDKHKKRALDDFINLVHPEDRFIIQNNLNKILEMGAFDDFECRIITSSGTIKYILVSGEIISDNDGTPLSLYGIVQDTTRQKLYENQLILAREKAEENEKILMSAQELAKLGSWELDIDTLTFKFTDNLFKLLHTSLEEMGSYEMPITEYVEKFIHPDDAYIVAEETEKAINTDDPDFTKYLEHRIKYLHGGVGYVSVRYFVIKNEQGKTIKSFGVIQDITEKKNAEIELIKAKEKAEESDRLKTAFLMNMSHEIRTPMNGILGFMGLLGKPDLNDEAKSRYLQIINRSGARLMNTINDIIEISKIEIGDIQLKYETINPFEIMQFHYDFFYPEIKKKGLDFELKNQVTELIETDKHMLDGILMNLLKNAIKFTENGKIEFGNYISDNYVCFYVTDTGMGIPEDKQEVIFNRFVQGDIRLIRNYEGSGLGLSIVKSYVDILKGTIEIKSEFEKGSTFMVSIPFVKAPYLMS